VTVWRGTISGNQMMTDWQLAYVDGSGALKQLTGHDVFQQK